MGRSVAGFLAVIAVFALVNVLLVGGQRLWHHGARVKLEALKVQLDAQRGAITECEAELKRLSASTDESGATIASLKARAQNVEQQHPSGIPSSVYRPYSELIDQCNLLVASHNANIARYDALYDDYSRRVDQYNALVREVNATSKQIGGTWYIIPVPGPRSSRGRAVTGLR